jgi:hypothetical protein
VIHANVPADRVIDEIQHGLGRLNAFLGFDRSTFWEFAPNGDRIALAAMELSVEAPEIRFDSVVRRAGLEVIEAARNPGAQ